MATTIEQVQALINADPEVKRLFSAGTLARGRYGDQRGNYNWLQANRPHIVQAMAELPHVDGKGWTIASGGQLKQAEGVPWYVPVIQAVGGAAVGPLSGLGGAAGAGGAAGGATAGGGAAALSPILDYAVPAAGSLINAGMQNSANNAATDAEIDFNNRALEAAREEQQYRRTFDEEARTHERARYADERDYGRGQRSQYLERLQPYEAAGRPSISRLEALLSGSLRRGGR